TLLVSVVVAVTLGVIAAARAGSVLDHAVMLLAIVGFSAPVFVTGYAMALVFAVDLQWLPVQGYTKLAQGFGPFLSHLVLPSIALGLGYVAMIARITRASMLEVLAQDYIRTAYAKGMARQEVLVVHALKNAAVPIVTVVGIGVALLISGVVVTETVFNIPGVGRLVVDAITRRDYPIIQGVTLVFSAVYVFINLLVDLSYVLFDPRVRL
ncbi:MAG: ABC transporter permease, partial [Nevskiales bacterium]